VHRVSGLLPRRPVTVRVSATRRQVCKAVVVANVALHAGRARQVIPGQREARCTVVKLSVRP
jgi:hypothetical protein